MSVLRIEVEPAEDPRVSELPALDPLWRIERTDTNGIIRFTRYFQSSELRWTRNYYGGDFPSRFFGTYNPTDLSRGWGYLFKFVDGTWGACQVYQIDLALAALGLKVNMEAECTTRW
jgi:hypothetical protein